MLPRLQAEESLLESQRITVGTGTAKPETLRAVAREWSQAAQLRKQKGAAATPETLRGIGIGVRTKGAR